MPPNYSFQGTQSSQDIFFSIKATLKASSRVLNCRPFKIRVYIKALEKLSFKAHLDWLEGL